MKKIILPKLLALLFLLFFCKVSSAQSYIGLKEIAARFNNPVDITNAGDDRLFIVEKGGRVKILSQDSSHLSTFLDIQSKVHKHFERGLLSLAFHPQYQQNGFLFVYYTQIPGDRNIVARFKISDTDPNLVDLNSEQIIYSLNANTVHNGGCLKFDTNGLLYISIGDLGAGLHSRDLSKPNGKILRINVDDALPYTIPSDNPFVNTPNALPEIWALGLRNPWRFSFDRLTGELWIGDVGSKEFEEINFQAANHPGGINYGWDCLEGSYPKEYAADCDSSLLTNPLFEYPTGGELGQSITGGMVYRGSDLPELYGHYIFADFAKGKIISLQKEANGIANLVDHGQYFCGFSSFGEDANSELYVACHSSGEIYKIEPASCELLSIHPQGIRTCTDSLDGSINTLVGGGTPPYEVNTSAGTTTNLAPGTYSLTVTDQTGCTKTDTVLVEEKPNPVPPIIEIIGDSLFLLNADDYPITFWNIYVNEEYERFFFGNPSTYIGDLNGEIKVAVNLLGCIAFSEGIPFSTTSLYTPEDRASVEIYPNPSKGQVLIKTNSPDTKVQSLLISNINGQILYRQDQFSTQQFTIDLDHLSEGLYFLQIKTKTDIQIQKLIIQK